MKALSMRTRAIICLNTTWDAIGGDILQALEEYGDGATSLPKDQVIEAVLDADHYESHGRDPEAAEYIRNLPNYAARIRLGKAAFTFDHYGW